MFRKYFLILITVLVSFVAKAQNDISFFSKQFNKHIKSDKDSTLYFLNKVKQVAELNKSYQDEYLNFKGLYAYYWENDIKGADKLFTDALVLAGQDKDSTDYYNILRSKSVTERDFGNTDRSFELLAQCSEYYKKKESFKNLATVYNNMALTMLYAKNEVEAEKYFKLALPLLEKYYPKESIASTEIGLATTLFTLKKNKEGMLYLDSAKKLALETGDSLTLADCYKEEGTNYADKADYIKATACLEKAKFIYTSYGIAESLGVVYTNLYTCYSNAGKMELAKACLDSAAYNINLLKQEDQLISIKWFQADYYKRIGDYKKANEIFERYVIEKDSMFGKENTDKINELNIRYKSVEKDNELLKDKAAITEKDLLIEKQRTNIYIVSVILLFLVITLLIVFYFTRKQKKLNTELSELNTFKDKVFTIISHDLRSPISSIVNHNKEPDTKNKAMSALHILDNLLHWSYPQLHKNQLKPVKIILLELVEEAISQTIYLTNSKHQKIHIEIDENYTFTGDHDTTLIILRNLLTNASRYTNENEIIIISQTGNEISITNTCSKNIEPGTGIGIKLCEDLAKQNNYTLRIEINKEIATAYLRVCI